MVDTRFHKFTETRALQALLLDPLVPDSATARAILDDAVAADPVWLARFAAVAA